MLTGWGLADISDGETRKTIPAILRKVDVVIIDNERCKERFVEGGKPDYEEKVLDTETCTDPPPGESKRVHCNGDSGNGKSSVPTTTIRILGTYLYRF